MKRFADSSKVSSAKIISPQIDGPVCDVDGTGTSSMIWKSPDSHRLDILKFGRPSTPLSESRDETFVMYAVKIMGQGPLAMTYYNVLSSNTSDLDPYQSTMRYCLLALATVFYGVQNGESTILKDGIRRYGQGLGMLGNVLGKDASKVNTEVIVSSLSLSICEVCQPFLQVCIFACDFLNQEIHYRASCLAAGLHG